MGILSHVFSAKDRFMLRLAIGEANDLAREQALCPAGCDAWLEFSYRRAEASESILSVQRRLQAEYGVAAPMSTIECYGLAVAAILVFIALLRAPMVI